MLRLGKKLIEADKKGEGLGLSSEEFAFFEALELNEAAVREMGDDVLCDIARDIAVIVEEYKGNVAWLDGNRRQMARFRRELKKVLRKYNYPPDEQESAVETVLEQARLSSVI
jgi:type I restriction enzyme R subunit